MVDRGEGRMDAGKATRNVCEFDTQWRYGDLDHLLCGGGTLGTGLRVWMIWMMWMGWDGMDLGWDRPTYGNGDLPVACCFAVRIRSEGVDTVEQQVGCSRTSK